MRSDGAYAQVMASLDASSAASGVEVEVKKRAPDGSYVPADDRDFATADFDAELEAVQMEAVQEEEGPSLRDLAVALTLVLRFVRSTDGKQTDDIGP